MKVLGVIVEYNPMHTGHIYHIQKAKQVTNSDYVIAIMSGSFTQQGNIAITDKFTRAKQAIQNGIDMVIELPSIYAISDSGNFAKGAIEILNKLNVVDYLCFGAETDNLDLFTKAADVLIKYDKNIWNEIRLELKKGISFANARNNVLKNYLSGDKLKLINSPNNILGIEYTKNLKLSNSNIVPYSILRENNFNDTNLSTKYTSSTSIRKVLEENTDVDTLKDYLTPDVYSNLTTSNILFNKDIFNILKYKIISMTAQQISKINGVTEGLENKIKKEMIDSYNYEDYIFKLKSKRYELSKIKRIVINILLDIKKEDFEILKQNPISYAHVLAFNHEKKDLLSLVSKNSKIPLITSINDKSILKLDKFNLKLINTDIYASNIHSLLNKTKLNKDYTNLL